MKFKALALIAGAALLVAGYDVAWSASGSSLSPAAQACGEVDRGASESISSCAQGYKGATAHATLAATCELGVEEVKVDENQRDCKLGFMDAGGVTQTAPTPTSAATSACEPITAGASDGSPAACEQGYQDALAGDTQDATCDHLGEGAVTAFEYETACEDGWFVAKGEPACIPGINPMNSEQGSTIASDPATDKTCAAA